MRIARRIVARPHLQRAILAAAAGLVAQQWFLPASSAQVPFVDQYTSTGDNFLEGAFLPEDSPASIQASFQLMQTLYGTQTIYWRGLQESSYIDTAPRPDNVYINSVIQTSSNLLNNENLNQVAVQTAHSLGMKIWGATQLYDWGVPAKDAIFYGYPGDYQTTFAANNPQWAPVDRYQDQRQGGEVDLSNPAARQAVVNWTMNQVNQTGYDGVLFMSYQENFTTKYADEYGFSPNIVADYLAKYGVNILKNPNFNLQNWYDLRGSYTTTFLSQMKAALGSTQLGMAVNPITPSQPSYWDGESFANVGDMTMAYQTWAQQGDVNKVVLFGTDPDTYNTVKAAVQPYGVSTTLFTSGPYTAGLQGISDPGAIAGAMNTDVQYLLQSNMPTQPLSSLNSTNVYQRMHVLAQIAAGQTSATSSQVLPLLNDSNIITRRLALTALAAIGDSSTVSYIEGDLTDPEEAIRDAAANALITLNGPNSGQALLNAIAQYGDANLNTSAVSVLEQSSTTLTTLQNAMSSSNAQVRDVAMQAIAGYSGAITSAQLPTLTSALSDSSGYVRRFAVDALGRVSGNPTAVSTLMGLLSNSDPLLSDQAATTLSGMILSRDSAALAQRSSIVTDITNLFKEFDNGSTRSDASWGYEPVGQALVALVPDGLTQIKNIINQRTDQTSSLNAWNVYYEPQTPLGSLPSMTPAQDAYAHFKMPRWNVAAVSYDNFDSHVNGSQINGQADGDFDTWTVAKGDVTAQTVQSAVSNGGLALKAVRHASDTSHLITLSSDYFNGQAAGLTNVTAKADLLRPTATDFTTFGIAVGPGTEAQVTVQPNSYYGVWETNGTATGGQYLQTNYQAGVGGWESLKIVVHWNLASGTPNSAGDATLTGDYDVYLARSGADSLGDMGSTLIASAVPLYSVTEQAAQQLFISNQPNGISDVTTYWDNVSMTVSGVVAPTLTWNNDSGTGDGVHWDSLNQNWNYGPGPSNFEDASGVTFNDSNNGNYAVTLNTTVNPASVTVNNSLGNYSITGTGSIVGTGSLTKSGTGTLTLGTANTYSGGTVVNAGTLVIQPTSSTTSALPKGSVTVNGGLLQLASNVTLGSQSAVTPASNVNITSLSISGNGTLDISNNHIIIDYTAGNDPIASIAAWIRNGFNGGSWNGTGITSSAAAANAGSYGIGYADAADPGNPAGLSSGQIEVMYALLGDLNLDGKVNGADFAILASNFNKAVAGASGWDQGDFNYDGKVNGSDFGLLALNFNKGADQSADMQALDAFAALNGISTAVPEPASAAVLLGIGSGILRRRRAARRRPETC
jgi:autotransporter-associated beta strand protein